MAMFNKCSKTQMDMITSVDSPTTNMPPPLYSEIVQLWKIASLPCAKTMAAWLVGARPPENVKWEMYTDNALLA